jgi:SpoVK/Ycf46/Vps4 family AAA+-type ATPase
MSDFIQKIQHYCDAAYPLLYIQSHEEQRVTAALQTLPRSVYHWSMTVGFRGPKKDDVIKETDARKTLETIIGFPRDSVIVLKDFHGYLGNLLVVRLIRDMLEHLESNGKTIIFLTPVLQIPTELEKDIVLVDFQIPDPPALEAILEQVAKDAAQASGAPVVIPERAPLVQAARGLTAAEAKNAFALALVTHGNLGEQAIRLVLSEKAGALKKSQLLTWIEPSVTESQLGGFRNVKAYLAQIAPIFWSPDEALRFGFLPEDFPRSIAFVGVPGTGKSLCAKLIPAKLKIGMVQTDFGRVFGSKVGESEQNIVRRNQLVEAMAPVVDWWDEAEKGLAGISGSRENPWEARVGGTLLTWAEEHRSRVLITATINDQTKLPPEMFSRFQKVFFVDLPTPLERMEIFTIHLGARSLKLDLAALQVLAEKSAGYNGREIRNIVQAALQVAFSTKSKVTKDLLLVVMKGIVPISRSRAREIELLRAWAMDNQIPLAGGDLPANDEQPRAIKVGGRGKP